MATLRELREQYEANEAELERTMPTFDPDQLPELRTREGELFDALNAAAKAQQHLQQVRKDLEAERAGHVLRWVPSLFWSQKRLDAVGAVDGRIAEIDESSAATKESLSQLNRAAEVNGENQSDARYAFDKALAWSRVQSLNLRPQSDLLEALHRRQLEVEETAQSRPDVLIALSVISEGRYISLHQSEPLLKKLAVFHDRWAFPRQSVVDVWNQQKTGAQLREYHSIVNDLRVVLGHGSAPWSELDRAENPEYEDVYPEYFDEEGFAETNHADGPDAEFERSPGLASSWDDHYIGPSNDDWMDGEPVYFVDYSGDDPYFDELHQRRIWLDARNLRITESHGERVLPVGIGAVAQPPSSQKRFAVLDWSDPYIVAASALSSTNYNSPRFQGLFDAVRADMRSTSLEIATAASRSSVEL